MTNALVPFDQLDRMAQSFADSKMFGDKKKEQVLALLMLAHSEGVHPAIAMRDFDIINGKPAKKAEAMHRAFMAGGGNVQWHQLDDTIADATFSHPQGGEARITWDMERVKKAKIANEAMYAKYPRQMLRSRCISEGCRTVYPAATSGLYVPEEVRDIAPEKNMGNAVVVHENQPRPGASSDAPPPSAGVGADRTKELQELAGKTTITVQAILTKAGCKTVDEMSDEDYAEACTMLKARKPKKA